LHDMPCGIGKIASPEALGYRLIMNAASVAASM